MKRQQLIEAGKTGGAAAAGVALIATGIGLIEGGDTVVGGILAGVGAVLIMVANYIGKG